MKVRVLSPAGEETFVVLVVSFHENGVVCKLPDQTFRYYPYYRIRAVD